VVVVELEEVLVLVELVVEELVNVGFTPVVLPPVVEVVVIVPDAVPPSEVTEIDSVPEIEAVCPLTLMEAKFRPSKSISPSTVAKERFATVSALNAELSKELLVSTKANRATVQMLKNIFFIINNL
jgi:hypothetical protein